MSIVGGADGHLMLPFVVSTLRFINYPRVQPLLESKADHDAALATVAASAVDDNEDAIPHQPPSFLYSRELLLSIAYLIASQPLLSVYHSDGPDGLEVDHRGGGKRIVAPADTSGFPGVRRAADDAREEFQRTVVGRLRRSLSSASASAGGPPSSSHPSLLIPLSHYLLQLTTRTLSLHSSIRRLDSHRMLMLQQFSSLFSKQHNHYRDPPPFCDYIISCSKGLCERVVKQLHGCVSDAEKWQRQGVLWRWMMTVVDEAESGEVRRTNHSKGGKGKKKNQKGSSCTIQYAGDDELGRAVSSKNDKQSTQGTITLAVDPSLVRRTLQFHSSVIHHSVRPPSP